jgi:hypothetical protein
VANIGRNRLHNSGFSVNQRTYVSGTALAAAAYAHDRWKAGAGGCTYTFTQTQPFTTITITAGTLQQIVEAMNVEGGAYVLSWTGTAQARINAGTYAASPVTITGLTANAAITVEFNAGTLGAAQLEPGSAATSVEKRDPMLEKALCQRFYQTAPLRVQGWAEGANVIAAQWQPFITSMRASPTITPNYSTQSNCAGSIGTTTADGFQPFAIGVATGQMNLQGTFTASADL